MPFTPIHLGPGAAFKAIGGRHFSFMVFGGAQVLMDIEPLLGILRGSAILHGYTHTLGGALLIGLVAALTGKPVSAFVLARLRIRHEPFSWRASFAGAYAGTLSHVGLDAVMHGDMNPLWPLGQGNAWLGAMSIDALHALCAVLGLAGAIILYARAYLPLVQDRDTT